MRYKILLIVLLQNLLFFVEGQQVRIKQGATQFGKSEGFAGFVYANTYNIISIGGTRVVFGKGQAVTGVTDISNIY